MLLSGCGSLSVLRARVGQSHHRATGEAGRPERRHAETEARDFRKQSRVTGQVSHSGAELGGL